MRRISFISILSAALSASSLTATAQCKGLAKDVCVPDLGDYVPNGRLYQSVLEKGQTGELHIVLNGGQQYRIVTCADDKLGKTEFQLLDTKGNVLFDNTEHGLVQHWDISVQSTQEFVFRTATGNKKGAGRGCSCILIGYKKTALDKLVE